MIGLPNTLPEKARHLEKAAFRARACCPARPARCRPAKPVLKAFVASHAAANVHSALARASRDHARKLRYNPRAVGCGGAMGMMQIKLADRAKHGLYGSAEGLLDANTNMTYAVKYFAGAYRAAEAAVNRAQSATMPVVITTPRRRRAGPAKPAWPRRSRSPIRSPPSRWPLADPAAVRQPHFRAERRALQAREAAGEPVRRFRAGHQTAPADPCGTPRCLACAEDAGRQHRAVGCFEHDLARKAGIHASGSSSDVLTAGAIRGQIEDVPRGPRRGAEIPRAAR